MQKPQFTKLLLLVFLISLQFSYAQKAWRPIGLGLGHTSTVAAIVEKDSLVYVGGALFSVNNNSAVSEKFLVTEGASWGVPANPTPLGSISAMAIYEDDIIIGGWFSNIGGDMELSNIARWDGENWHSLGRGLNNQVSALFVDGTGLYAGGRFTDAGGDPDADRIALWDGVEWTALGQGFSSEVSAILKVGDDLFAGGAFNTFNGSSTTARAIAGWDGQQWYALTENCDGFGPNSIVHALFYHDSKLFVGALGSRNCQGNNPTTHAIMYYDPAGRQFISQGTGVEGRVRDIVAYEGVLHICGSFDDAGGDPEADNIARWNGSNWESLDMDTVITNGSIHDLAVIGEDLYVGGAFDNFNGNEHNDGITRWGEEVLPAVNYNITHFQIPPQEGPSYNPKELQNYNAQSMGEKQFTLFADGSESSLFCVEYMGLSNISNLSFKILEDPFGLNADFYGQFTAINNAGDSLLARYQHPQILDNPFSVKKAFTVAIIDESLGNPVANLTFEVYRTPVLMVHGLWGDGNSFKAMKDFLLSSGRYQEFQLLAADYKSTNSDHFETNRFVIPLYLGYYLNTLHEAGFAIGEVNIVAHSMGGILARQYLQSTTYQYDINKLITLNTPHSGSQMANLLLDANFPEWKRQLFCTALPFVEGGSCYQGAVEDLKVNSSAILNDLNGAGNLNANTVPSHTISSTIGTIEPYTEPWFIKLFLELDDQELLELFNGEAHDLIVAESSQRGGFSPFSPYTSQFTKYHTETSADISVMEAVKELLEQKPSGLRFTDNGFFPLQLSYQTPERYQGSPSDDHWAIDIVTPDTGLNVLYGNEVTINIVGEEGIEEILVFYGGNSTITYEDYESFEGNVVEDHAYRATPAALGKFPITAAGFDEEKGGMDSTYIVVSTNDIPFRIEPYTTFTILEKGGVAFPSFYAIFPGYEVEVSRAPGIEYHFNNNIATQEGDGIIRGLEVGVDTLRVVFNGVESAPMAIYVIETNGPPNSNDFNSHLKKSGQLNLFPSPAEDNLTVVLPDEQLQNGYLQLFDVVGKLYYENSCDFQNKKMRLDVSILPSGIYFITLQSHQSLFSGKFVKH